VNPWASFIDLPDQVFKPRRTLSLLLGFIEAVTFYHQYQRKVRQDAQGRHYIESSPDDIEIAFGLLKEALFTKGDELNHACRKFFERLKKEVGNGAFRSQEIRQTLRIAPSTLKRHLLELTRYGHLKANGGNRYKGFEYSIADAEEYGKLTGSIERQLKEIIQKIKEVAR
jgi:DNA primase